MWIGSVQADVAHASHLATSVVLLMRHSLSRSALFVGCMHGGLRSEAITISAAAGGMTDAERTIRHRRNRHSDIVPAYAAVLRDLHRYARVMLLTAECPAAKVKVHHKQRSCVHAAAAWCPTACPGNVTTIMTKYNQQIHRVLRS